MTKIQKKNKQLRTIITRSSTFIPHKKTQKNVPRKTTTATTQNTLNREQKLCVFLCNLFMFIQNLLLFRVH